MSELSNPVLETIWNRKSVRRFTPEAIPEDIIREILKCGMAGPSAVNARPWRFYAVTDRAMLCRMADGNGPAAEPLRTAALGVLVCGDLSRALARAPEFWVIDGSIACQNMILAAQSLGVSSVWLGTWPLADKCAAQAELFGLPENEMPHSLIAFGYRDALASDGRPPRAPKPEWEEDRVVFL